MEESQEIPRRLRIRLLGVAWAVALVVTPIPGVVSNPGTLPYFVMYAWLFPVGLISLGIPTYWDKGPAPNWAPSPAISVATLVGGWFFYLALTFLGLVQNRRLRYFIVYGILCALLFLNAVSCNVNVMKGP